MSLRISDIIEYSPTKEAFIQSIGVHNAAVLEELKELHLYDFGIFLDLQPDDEERQKLENNIQMALQQQSIDLEDVIDLREINNIKLANQLNLDGAYIPSFNNKISVNYFFKKIPTKFLHPA